MFTLASRTIPTLVIYFGLSAWFGVKEGEASSSIPENDTYKLLAQVQGDECPSIAAAAKYRRFPVAHVLIVPQLRTRSPGAVKGSLGDPPHEFKPAAASVNL